MESTRIIPLPSLLKKVPPADTFKPVLRGGLEKSKPGFHLGLPGFFGPPIASTLSPYLAELITGVWSVNEF